jgi:hypothetical protein
MTKISNIYNLGHYDDYIIHNFVINHCGIDLNKLGQKTSQSILKVDLEGQILIDINLLRSEISSTINFIQNFYSFPDDRPIWHRINVIDQAINQYIGVGFLSLESNWINFIINYLDIDRAEQGGDTILTIFDRNFNWAVSFTLIQDDNILKIEKYEKQKNGI